MKYNPAHFMIITENHMKQKSFIFVTWRETYTHGLIHKSTTQFCRTFHSSSRTPIVHPTLETAWKVSLLSGSLCSWEKCQSQTAGLRKTALYVLWSSFYYLPSDIQTEGRIVIQGSYNETFEIAVRF